MLIGRAQHALDDKGRYTVPALFRDDLGCHIVITEGVNGCLFIFPHEQWLSVAEELANRPAENEEDLQFKREFFGSAFDLELDKQFRVVLPPDLRSMAGLTREVVTSGAFNRLELWDKEAWEQYRGSKKVTEQSKARTLSGIVL